MNTFNYIVALVALVCQCAAADWQQRDGYRFRDLQLPAQGKTGFTKLPPATTGIAFTNILNDARSVTNRNLVSGSGVAAGDVDGDGLCDLYFCGLDSENILYRNLGGWKFEDISTRANVACAGQDSTGPAFADVDGDGDLDLLVNALGNGARLFLNNGKGHFSENTDAAGLRSRSGAMSLALADIEGDGDLDLYVANFRPTTIKDNPHTTFSMQIVNGRAVVAAVDGRPATAADLTNRFVAAPSGTVFEFGEADVLYLNDGKGIFRPASWTDGRFLDEQGKPLREPPRDWSLAVQMRDLNNDGAPDIYVCADLFTPDRIWMSDGRGNFRALDNLALRSTPTFSMGADFADIDRDGHLDWFMVDMFSREHEKRHTQLVAQKSALPMGVIDARTQLLRNTLHWNRGDNTFAEIAWFAGVEAADWSWGPIFIDVDLDGFEDILVTNGQLRDFQDIDLAMQMEQASKKQKFTPAEIAAWHSKFPRLNTPNVAFRNRGDLTFEEVGPQWGFNSSGISQGMALADLDNDGDLDVIVNDLNDCAGIYRNETTSPRIAVRLKSAAGNTHGIGAKIRLIDANTKLAPQQREIISGGRYISGDDAICMFAAPTADSKIVIQWRDGRESTIADAKPNRIYEIDQTRASTPTAPNPKQPAPPLFEDVSEILSHTHTEEPFDDFQRQPLLPNRLSQSGPAVSWYDLDADGWDDLFIGAGKGGTLAMFRNDQKGRFPIIKNTATRPSLRDQTSILGAAGRLHVAYSNYEDALTNDVSMRVFDFKNRTSNETLPAQISSAGPMALADIDGDGDLDLYVGGRVIPGRYPEPASSLLLTNHSGKFSLAREFKQIGLVPAATFSDLDGDGFPELILACEWGPVRIFQNTRGNFSDATEKLGLAQYLGWWNAVATGDFNNDGRLDIVASNWGLNTHYRTSPEHPVLLYYKDLAGHGALDLIEARFEPSLRKEAPLRDMRAIASSLPFVAEKMRTFSAYAKSGLPEIFGDAIKDAPHVKANTLASMLFLNRGDHFEAVPLPRDAQLSVAFGISVADFDGDGAEDLFLSQNFFAANSNTDRADSGRGLLLRGDGKGALTPLSAEETGIKVYGEQRACAVSDYDRDGRVDLVVTQNAQQTKLYRNKNAKPALRVRLVGPPANPEAIGAQLRLIHASRQGPIREIRAGSGYLSQDSAVQILAAPEPPTALWVRWPGGNTTTTPLAAAVTATEITIDQSGAIQAPARGAPNVTP